MAMRGTSFSVTAVMRCRPPRMTTATNTTTMMPTSHMGMAEPSMRLVE